MKSRIFFTSAYQDIQQATLHLLNSQQSFLSPGTLHSTRAAGDAIERIISDSFDTILGNWSSEYSAAFARRAMADLAFKDVDGFYYVVDVKTHRSDTWMLELCDVLMEFYPREISKITMRIDHFEKVRAFWLAKPDD
jgi:hypothetical protein